jgi:hypothetical protein
MVKRAGFQVEVRGEDEDKDAIDKMCLRMR